MTPTDLATTSHPSRLCRKGRHLFGSHLAPCGLAPAPQSLAGQRVAVTCQDKPLPAPGILIPGSSTAPPRCLWPGLEDPHRELLSFPWPRASRQVLPRRPPATHGAEGQGGAGALPGCPHILGQHHEATVGSSYSNNRRTQTPATRGHGNTWTLTACPHAAACGPPRPQPPAEGPQHSRSPRLGAWPHFSPTCKDRSLLPLECCPWSVRL